MKRAWRYIALGIALYFLILIITFPAPWAYTVLVKKKTGDIVFDNLSGTLWKGQASHAYWGTYQIDHLRWRLKVWPLILGQLQTELKFDYQAAAAHLVIIGKPTGGWLLQDVTFQLPASLLGPIVHLNGTQITGVINVQLGQLAVQGGRLTAVVGNVIWHKAALQSPTVQLGDFRADFITQGQHIQAKLADQGGPVQADGLLTLKPDGNYQFTAYLMARNHNQPLLTEGLQLLGPPGPDGRIRFAHSGTMPLL